MVICEPRSRGSVSPRWRELQAERAEEAVAALSEIHGVIGVIVGGSIGRNESWPLSDIDVVPIVDDISDASEAIEQLQGRMVDWWATSGRAQTLDVGWLTFSRSEAEAVIAMPIDEGSSLVADPRWLHGLDKCYGGVTRADTDELTQSFSEWATHVRFHPSMRQARAEAALTAGVAAQQLATTALAAGDVVGATVHARQAARELRLVHIEAWSERLGSLGREWTRFERIAAGHGGGTDIARACADLAGASIADTERRAQHAPVWLQERIELSYEARRVVGDEVSEAENRRDQIAAFSHLVARHQPDSRGARWLGLTDHDVDASVARLAELIARISPVVENEISWH